MDKIRAIEVPKSKTFTGETPIELDNAFNTWVIENERAVLCKITPGVIDDGYCFFYWLNVIYIS